MARRSDIAGFALRALCVLALLFVSFAHRVPAAAAASDGFAAEYVLPDGSFAGLCLSGDAHGPDGKVLFKPGCEACRLSASLLLPPPPLDGLPILHPVTAPFVPWRLAGLSLSGFSPGNPSRGPPSLI